MKHQTTITILSLVFNVAMGIFMLVTGKPFSAAPHFLQGYREYQSLEQPPLNYGSNGIAQATHDQCGGSLMLDLNNDVVYCSTCKAVIRLLKSSQMASTKSTQSFSPKPQPNQDLVSVVEVKSPSYQNSKMRYVLDFSDPFAPVQDNPPKDRPKKEKWTPTQLALFQEIRNSVAASSNRDGKKHY